jgi:uncharacterized protein (TIGR04222 family)
MTESQIELLERLEAFTFDQPGTQFTFAQRLARETQWSPGYTRRAIAEYRRFLFLCMQAGSPMCPSEAVDEVWHLHLIYTRSYWEDLCQGVLGRPLHHGPTRGGTQEKEKHHRMYEETLESYRRFFGEVPPSDLWPSVERRFREAAQYVRVNRRTTWLVNKPRWLMGVVAMSALSLAGCELRGTSVFDYSGSDFIAFFGCLLVGLVAVLVLLRAWCRLELSNRIYAKEPKDPYMIAMLSGGGQHAIVAALCELTRRGMLLIPSITRIARKPGVTAPAGMHPFEDALWQRIPPVLASMKEINTAVGVELRAMAGSLSRDGMMLSIPMQNRFRLTVKLLISLVLLAGVVKVVTGVVRDKPVLILAGMIVACVLIYRYVRRRIPFRTRPGDLMISALRRDHFDAMHNKHQLDSPDLPTGILPMAVGLYGASILYGTSLSDLADVFAPERRRVHAAGDSGCHGCTGSHGGSGGGTSGCNSGCGGCSGGD